MNLLIKILQYLKYRKIKFLKIGTKCNFKALSSNSVKANKISFGNNVWIGKGADFDGAGGI